MSAAKRALRRDPSADQAGSPAPGLHEDRSAYAPQPGAESRPEAARALISGRGVEAGRCAVQRIVGELAEAGYVRRTRKGRRNRYTGRGDLPLRHPVEAHRRVGDLAAAVGAPASGAAPDAREGSRKR